MARTPARSPVPALKIGELAEATGISVRTLHWYEEIGLLRPARRTSAGHRLYSDTELLRLQQILSLRALGLSLDEIGALLAQPDATPLDAIERHLARAREELAEKERLIRRLEALSSALREAKRISTEELLHTIEVTVMFEKYYSKEQLEKLAERRRALGEETIKAAEAEWPTLIEKMTAAMEANVDPADASLQPIADRWMELVNAFTGGDPGIRSSLEKMYKEEPAMQQRTGVNPELMAYVGRVLAARKGA